MFYGRIDCARQGSAHLHRTGSHGVGETLYRHSSRTGRRHHVLQQFFVKGLAHSSCLLAGSDTCAIVGPQRDVEVYLQAAAEMGMAISHIIQTHLHADFVSGHLDLADATGAPIYVPASAECGFEHVAVSDGSSFAIGDLTLTVLETPGPPRAHILCCHGQRSRVRAVRCLLRRHPLRRRCGPSRSVPGPGR
jgi:hypothetical protein